MWQGVVCENGDKPFKEGITQGWQWVRTRALVQGCVSAPRPRRLTRVAAAFEAGGGRTSVQYPVYGGMQDYNYHYANVMEITVEVACTKWPDEATLSGYWNEHANALLAYVQQPLEIGMTGVVTDAQGKRLAGATISLDEVPGWSTYTDSSGVFWRLAAPGRAYTVRAEVSGYLASTAVVAVATNQTLPAVLHIAVARNYTFVIAMMTLGVILLVALLVGIIVYCVRARRQQCVDARDRPKRTCTSDDH